MIEFLIALKETAIMTLIPTIIAIIFGIPIGAILFLTNPKGIKPNKVLYNTCNILVNVIRSFPFLIFVVCLIPITRLVIGTAFGVYAASFPICFVAVALYSRFVEQSFNDIPQGIIDLALSMKLNSYQIVRYFLIVEARQSLVLGLTSCIISIISYTTVMGIVAAGGIGDYAMQNGYMLLDYAVIYKAVVVIVIIVYSIQFLGNKIARILDKKRRDV
ncbi:methionine ABC transporter permease [Oceanivirga salmonicida]|uniref:methionine ABC transporter permease n=1 Tax=Oceanivirga salmonicida TaxID=1769291 RepID=UPI0008362F62|nr:ABC transporter permease subunit [Oceanivirga salmonicida]